MRALVQGCAHPELEVPTYPLAVDIQADYGGMLPPAHWPRAGEDPEPLLAR